MIKQKFYSKLRETNDEVDRLRDERNEYKNRLDTKERDQVKSESKIKALEKIINANSIVNRTPMHSSTSNKPMVTPVNTNAGSSSTTSNNCGNSGGGGSGMLNPTMNTVAFNSGGSSNSATSGADTPLSTPYRSSRIQQLTNSIVRNNAAAAAAAVSNTPAPPPQTPSGRIGSIINSAAYNRYQTPAKPPVPGPPSVQASAMRDGVPVANRRNQRRSKSAEMWLDHRPPSTSKTG